MHRSFAITALLCLASCGEDGGASAETPSRDTTLMDLTEPERRGVCQELNEVLGMDPEYAQVRCTNQAVLRAAAGEGACDALRKTCINGDSAIVCNEDVFASNTDVGPGNCGKVTVGLYLGCLRALQDDSTEYFGDVTCETSADELRELIDERIPATYDDLPAECEPVRTLCPDFLSL